MPNCGMIDINLAAFPEPWLASGRPVALFLRESVNHSKHKRKMQL